MISEELFLFSDDLLADPAILAFVLNLVLVLNSLHMFLHRLPERSFFFADREFVLLLEKLKVVVCLGSCLKLLVPFFFLEVGPEVECIICRQAFVCPHFGLPVPLV